MRARSILDSVSVQLIPFLFLPDTAYCFLIPAKYCFENRPISKKSSSTKKKWGRGGTMSQVRSSLTLRVWWRINLAHREVWFLSSGTGRWLPSPGNVLLCFPEDFVNRALRMWYRMGVWPVPYQLQPPKELMTKDMSQTSRTAGD